MPADRLRGCDGGREREHPSKRVPYDANRPVLRGQAAGQMNDVTHYHLGGVDGELCVGEAR